MHLESKISKDIEIAAVYCKKRENISAMNPERTFNLSVNHTLSNIKTMLENLNKDKKLPKPLAVNDKKSSKAYEVSVKT